MKKLLLAAVVAFSFAACGDNTEENSGGTINSDEMMTDTSQNMMSTDSTMTQPPGGVPDSLPNRP